MSKFAILVGMIACLELIVSIQGVEKVVLIATNDIHGSALPAHIYRSDTQQNYYAGGLQFLAHMIKTVQNEYEGNNLYVDAGDQWQGGIESSSLVSKGQIMNQFYDRVNLNVWSVGNHEFDNGPTFLSQFIDGKNQNIQQLSANLKNKQGGMYSLDRLRNSKIFTLKNGLKIGIVGLTTTDTPYSSDGFIDNQFPNAQFYPYRRIIRKQSAKLRLRGVNAVILLSHVGDSCNTNQTFGFWKKDTIQNTTCKNKYADISNLLKEMPEGTIDAVIQGHKHSFAHHYFEDVPILGTNAYGKYFNLLHLTFDSGKLIDTMIQGPIPICEKIFENTKTCSYHSKQKLAHAGQLVNWNFHGKRVEADSVIKQLFEQKWLPQMKEYNKILAFNQIQTLKRDAKGQSELGNLFTNLVHNAFPSYDVVIIGKGMFRATWHDGNITFNDLYDMFPYSDSLIGVQMTGSELIETLKVIQIGRAAPYFTYGLHQQLLIDSYGDSSLKNVNFINGSIIQNDQILQVITTKFLISGGDDFSNVIGKIYTPRNIRDLGDFREITKGELIKLETIKQNSLIDSNYPRWQKIYEQV